MSVQARQALVRHRNTVFQRDSQRHDLLDVTATQSALIALLTELCITKGHAVEFTAIKADHHDDRGLGQHCHFNGWCADLWPLASPRAGDYLEASDPRFAAFCRDADMAANRYQIGLAGSAWTHADAVAAGSSCFHDDGGDHVHLGAQ